MSDCTSVGSDWWDRVRVKVKAQMPGKSEERRQKGLGSERKVVRYESLSCMQGPLNMAFRL